MMIDPKSIGVVILAGGRSSRMNYPKPWLYLRSGATFLEKIVRTYERGHVGSVVVVLNQEFGMGRWRSKLRKLNKETRVVLNDKVDKGRLYSIGLGLEKLKGCDYVFIQNVDSPLIDHETICELISNRKKDAVVQPVFEGKSGHPVLLSASIVKHLINEKNQETTLREALAPYEKIKVEIEDEYVLLNVNTFNAYLGMKNEFV